MDDLTASTRELTAKLEDVLMDCDERGVWDELARIVNQRADDGEPVSGDFILHTWAALVRA